MAKSEDLFLRAKHRTFSGLTEDAEREWKGPFFFIQAADPQLGLMKAWRDGDCDGGGDEWGEEVELTQRAVEACNQMRPRPRFLVLCGDLVHAMPDTPFREGQERDLKEALKRTDPSIPLVFVSGNHDLGNTPTPRTVEQYCSAWGNDYFSFWVGGVLCLVLNSQLFYDASACPQLKDAQETWLEEQLSRAASSTEPRPKHVLVFQHIPLYLKSPDEEDDYFNLRKAARQNLLARFKKAGRTADTFCSSLLSFLISFRLRMLIHCNVQVSCGDDDGDEKTRSLKNNKFKPPCLPHLTPVSLPRRGESRVLRPLSPKRRRLPRRPGHGRELGHRVPAGRGHPRPQGGGGDRRRRRPPLPQPGAAEGRGRGRRPAEAAAGMKAGKEGGSL
uniref:Calcineurin-like phosphoesterase domain containing 1 n=1 Tax=Gasterosteus aculeatus aculeatus TaxID=481459 RepID=A0AAQ4P5B6_GASAC